MKAILAAIRPLRKSLLRSAVLLVIGAATATAVQRMIAEAASTHARESARQATLRTESMADGAASIESSDSRYREILARGIVGAERRIDWLQRISQTREARLAEIEYELAPQQPAVIETLPSRVGRHQFMASTMKLRLSLVHEQDLLDFFDELNRSVPAILRVRACRMARVAEADGVARLKADCTIDWITLRESP